MRALHRLLLVLTLIATISANTLPPRAAAFSVPAAPLAQDSTPLTAKLDSTVKPDAFPPNQPLIVRFSAPVDPESAPMPVLTDPYLVGESAWSEDNTLLTFTPEGGLRPGTTYQIYLNPDLTGANGAVFDPLPHWSLITLAAPRLMRIEPAGGLIRDTKPLIRLSFDSPIDPETATGAFSMTPTVPYDLKWDQQKLEITLREPLKLGEHYQFSLSGSVASKHGVPLGQDVVWDYWVDTLRASVKLLQDKWIEVNFNYPLDGEKSARPFQIEPEIAGEWHWSDKDTARYSLETHFAAVPEYTVSFTAPLVGASGEEMDAPEPVRFEPPLPISSYGPTTGKNEYIKGHPDIWIRFTRPVDHASVEAAFTTSPSFTGEFRWDIDQLIFTPEEDYPENTLVTVTLADTAKDAYGEPLLLESLTWEFYVPWYSQYYDDTRVVSFGDRGPNVQVLSAEGRRAVQFKNYSKTPAVFTLYRIEPGEFAALYRSHFTTKNYYGNYSMVDTSDLEKLQTWPLAYESEVQETLLPEGTNTGVYLIEAGQEGNVSDQLFLIVTDYKLVLKLSGERIWVWATDFAENNAEGLHVRLYTSTGEILREGDTDAEGIFSTSLPKDNKPMLVTAMDEDGDITVAGLSSAWQGDTGEWWWGGFEEPAPARYYRGYIYTERPIYQPGQEVFFKAIVRGDDDVHYTLPDEGTPISVRLLDARGNEVQTQELLLNAFGTVNGSFELGQGAMLGNYTIEVVFEGETFASTFIVQDYRKPDYEVDITLGANAYVTDDEVTVDIDTRYFFGKPVSNATLTAAVYRLSPSSSAYDEWWKEITFNTEPLRAADFSWLVKWKSVPVPDADANGHAVMKFRANLSRDHYYDCRSSWRGPLRECFMGIEITASDGSGQVVTASKAIRVYSSPVKYSIDAGNWRKRPGEEFEVVITAVDMQGNPAADRAAGIRVLGYSKNWDQRVITKFDGRTGLDGKLIIPVKLEEEGYFEVELIEQRPFGDYFDYTSDWIYVSGKGSTKNQESYGSFKIEAEYSEYKPFDKAKLLITSPFDGPALLTFERGQIIHTKLVMLTAPLTEVEVEIIPEDAPNIFVKVNAWQGEYQTLAQILEERKDRYYTIESLRDARLYTDQVELIVDAGANRLNIAIQSDKEQYKPREDVALAIKVTDAQNRPVQAEFSVALVDEALFSLVEDRSGSIFDAFYAPRAHNVTTFNSLALTRHMWWGEAGGGGGVPDPFLPVNPRSNFPDTAVWLPDVRTDENGVATVQVTLPDNLTSWRVIVKAVTTGTKVGEATANIITQQEAIVRPLLPQELVVGDTVSLTAMVHNYGAEERTFVATLSADGLTREGEASQPVTVEAGGMQPVVWQVNAERAGPVIVTMGVMAPGGIEDAVELPLEVRERSVHEITSQSGEFTGDFTGILALPPRLLPSSTAEIKLSRSIGGSMMEGLQYLTGYPYGCVEQTMSRALPNAVVGRALSKLGVEQPGLAEELPALINNGLQILYGYQHNDGGWGWWYDDATDVYQSAWVVFGLSVTREAGYPVDEKVIERGAAYLKLQLEGSALDSRTRAYVIYSLQPGARRVRRPSADAGADGASVRPGPIQPGRAGAGLTRIGRKRSRYARSRGVGHAGAGERPACPLGHRP